MKTRMTIVATLAAMLCGCRVPGALTAKRESGGHAVSAEEASVARTTSALPAAIREASEPEDSSNPPVSERLARAEQALRAQQLVVARSHLQSILVQQPDHPRAHHLLAVISDLEGRYSEAEQHYFTALAQDPQNPNIIGDLGYSYYLQSRFAESERYLQQALQIDSRHTASAKNLAQLYSDRGETSRAEALLRSSLPVAEAERALSQLRQQPPQENPAPSSNLPGRNLEPTGDELARRIQEEINAAARDDVAARELSRRESEFREASQTVARGPVDQIEPPEYEGAVSVNPWSRQLSSIDAGGSLTNGAHRQTANAAAAPLPAINPIQNVSGQSRPGDSTAVEFAAEARPAGDATAESSARRWPTAAWAPLMDGETPGATNRPPTIKPPYPPQYPHGNIDQLSGTVNPWGGDVQQAAGQDDDSSVERAIFEQANGAGPQVIPASVQAANTPAAIRDWDARTSSARSQYPPANRNLPRDPTSQPTDGMPIINTPPGPLESYQSVGRPYDDMRNAGVESYARSANPVSAPGAGAAPRSSEVPPYPRGPAAGAAPPVTPESWTPWPSRITAADDASSGWTQEPPNTSASSTTNAASTRSGSSFVVPEPYRYGQSSGDYYERYPVPTGVQQSTSGRY